MGWGGGNGRGWGGRCTVQGVVALGHNVYGQPLVTRDLWLAQRGSLIY